MDIMQDSFFDICDENGAPKYENTQKKPPFPDKDYRKNGSLKKVRPRMIGKLVKQDLLHYLPLTIFFGAVMLLSSIYFRLAMDKITVTMENGYTYTYRNMDVIALLLYVFACFGGLIYTQAAPVKRYTKNFFENEGYLTFSIPASIEEQVFSKRLGAWLLGLVVGTLFFISFIIAFGTNIFGHGGNIPKVHLVFQAMEGVIVTVLSGFTLHSIYGAYACLFSKSTTKKKNIITFAVFFVVFFLLESVIMNVGGIDFPVTLAQERLAAWVGIFLQVCITVGCTVFEIWYLKNKLDLK